MHDESSDWQRLGAGILRQAAHDYITLQHPRMRDRPSVQTAYETSVQMFTDPEFTLEEWENGHNEALDLQGFMAEVLGREHHEVDVNVYKNNLFEDSIAFWSEKPISRFVIPPIVWIEGRCFYVYQKPLVFSYEISHQTSEIFLNEELKQRALADAFLEACIEIAVSLANLNVAKQEQAKLLNVVYRFLKVNECFTFKPGQP